MPIEGVTQIDVANESKLWLQDLVKNGLVYYDSSNHFQVPDHVKAVVDALHTVLAGGEVEITVKVQGDADLEEQLGEEFRKAVDATNSIIGAHGSDVAFP